MTLEDPTFSLRVYVHATKRRERLTEAERREFNRAVEWAEWAQVGTNGDIALPTVASSENGEQRKTAVQATSD
jgi:hypothetical protein